MDSWERLSLAEGGASAKVLQQKLLFMLRTGRQLAVSLLIIRKGKLTYICSIQVCFGKSIHFRKKKKKGVLDVETTARNPNGCYLGWGEETELG